MGIMNFEKYLTVIVGYITDKEADVRTMSKSLF